MAPVTPGMGVRVISPESITVTLFRPPAINDSFTGLSRQSNTVMESPLK